LTDVKKVWKKALQQHPTSSDSSSTSTSKSTSTKNQPLQQEHHYPNADLIAKLTSQNRAPEVFTVGDGSVCDSATVGAQIHDRYLGPSHFVGGQRTLERLSPCLSGLQGGSGIMTSSNGQGSPIMLCNSSFTGQPLHDTHASKVAFSIDAKTYFACVHQRFIGQFGMRHGGFYIK
jgi:hypothetical protein